MLIFAFPIVHREFNNFIDFIDLSAIYNSIANCAYEHEKFIIVINRLVHASATYGI